MSVDNSGHFGTGRKQRNLLLGSHIYLLSSTSWSKGEQSMNQALLRICLGIASDCALLLFCIEANVKCKRKRLELWICLVKWFGQKLVERNKIKHKHSPSTNCACLDSLLGSEKYIQCNFRYRTFTTLWTGVVSTELTFWRNSRQQKQLVYN